VCVASFYATKLLTTGEGGMLLTDDAGIAALARDLRDYDNRDDFRVRYAYKMSDFQAALGRVQLGRLPEFVARRREIAALYSAAFSGLPLGLPDSRVHVFFRYVVRLSGRDAFQEHLENKGVMAKHPVHRPSHYLLGGEYTNAEITHQECL
jgi:perosamine synthetase